MTESSTRVPRRRLRRWACLALLVGSLMVAGCGDEAPQSTDSPASPSPSVGTAGTPTGGDAVTTPPGETPTPSGSGTEADEPVGATPELLTESDDGAQVDLSVGAELPLRLASEWSWDEPTVEGEAVVLSPVDYLADPGFSEWTVTAAQPGTARIVVQGQPACADPAACPPSSVAIEIAVR